MTKRAMISQPMAGKTDEEIAEARDKACAKLREMGYEFVNTLFTDEWYSDEAMEDGVPDCRIWTCHRCNESFPVYRGFSPAYCQNCGAEVVEDD